MDTTSNLKQTLISIEIGKLNLKQTLISIQIENLTV